MKTLTILHRSRLYTAHVWLDGTVLVEPGGGGPPVPNPPPDVLDEIDRLYMEHNPLVEEDEE